MAPVLRVGDTPMAIYTVLLAEGREPADAGLVVYTAPEAGVVVVRDIVLGGFSGGSILIGMLALTGSVQVPLVYSPNLPNASTLHWEGRQVLLAGQSLLFVSSDGPATYRVTGYHLGVP